MRERGRITGRVAWGIALGCLGVAAGAPAPAADPIPPAPWPAADALGRVVPMAGEAPAPRPGKFVGIFYFLTHNDLRNPGPEAGPNDISKILSRDPEALRHPDSPLWKRPGGEYYWGEPLLGYYRSMDPWVIRRHAQLLAAAGVDTLIFDTTNAVTYPDVYTRICEVFRQVRSEGGRTPQVCFMVNSQAGKTARELSRDLYEPGRFRDLWFAWQGKPLLICDPAEAGPELKERFTLRKAHWPHTQVNTPYAWHWEATYPQVYGYTDDPKAPEEVNVSVAQNLRARDGLVTNMSYGDARGRSFHGGAQDPAPGAVDRGLNFQEQWKRALELDPPFVMVTGWNEWTAGRYQDDRHPIVFVDQYDQEFSRDIEPMRGGHGDNYYYQLVANVRRYKGVPAVPKASPPKVIPAGAGPEAWAGVGPEYRDDLGETGPRDEPGVAGLHYEDRTGRNDLASFKVARSPGSLAFLARARAPLSPRTDPEWMWLLLDADRDRRTGWEGYDFLVNRVVEPDGSTWLERNEGGWRWSRVARVEARAAGDALTLTIPRAALGLPEAGGFALDFKWADHAGAAGDLMDFYSRGDVAPEGRFNYRYAAD